MRLKQTGWVRLLPPLLLLPLAAIPPNTLGRFFWGVGVLAMIWSAIRIVLFLIRILWELADKRDSDPDMRGILRSLLTVGVMILAFCSLALNRQMARDQALTTAVRIQADCNYYGRCPETIRPEHIRDGGNPKTVGGLMAFPVFYRLVDDSAGYVFEVRLTYRERLLIEGGRARVMKWYMMGNGS